jgi:acyl carrier protein
MSDSGLMGAVIRIVAEALDKPVAEVLPTASLVTDLGAESLDFIDLTFRIESAFGITIVENDLWRTVDTPAQITPATIVAYLESRGVTTEVESPRD